MCAYVYMYIWDVDMNVVHGAYIARVSVVYACTLCVKLHTVVICINAIMLF